MRDIDWWCLIETCLYVNEIYRLMMSYGNMNRVCMLMRDIDWWCLIEMRDIDWWCHVLMYVNERNRLMSYWYLYVRLFVC